MKTWKQMSFIGILAILTIIVIACTPKRSETQSQTQAENETTIVQPQTQTVVEPPQMQSEIETVPQSIMTSADFEIDGTILVRYIGNGGHVVIPSSVTAIGAAAFYQCTSLTSVVIPSSVTVIELIAFAESGLTNVTFSLPSSVTEIGDNAFKGCASLTSITIPSSVTVIKGFAFASSGLTNVEFSLPSSLSVIYHSAFESCKSLTSIDIPSSVTEIGGDAFADCTSLNTVTLSRGTDFVLAGQYIDLGQTFPNGVQINYRD